MHTVLARKPVAKPFILTKRIEGVLKTIHFYRYMAALDVTRLLYSPSSLTYVRSLLSCLAGGKDFKTNQYLYRFQLPNTSTGNTEKIYTLGSKGQDFLAKELGLSVDWYFRPYKVRHFSYNQIVHNLVITRFLVAAHTWSAKQPDFKLTKTRICYELAGAPATVALTKRGKTEKLKVIPDAWLLFQRLKNGEHEHWFPILLEIDRGMEYQQRFKRHVRSRIEFIRKGGAYSKVFATEAVTIVYATTGETPDYREARRRAMCAWATEVLKELGKESWASIFRICSVVPDKLYTTPLFDEPVWYRPDSPTPVTLFTP